MAMSAYSMPELADSTTAFLNLPSPVPRKATVKSPVEVAVTEVRRVGKVSTCRSESVQFDYMYTDATATANAKCKCKNTYRRSSDWQFASEGCVHVKSAELLSDLSELCVDAAKTREKPSQ